MTDTASSSTRVQHPGRMVLMLRSFPPQMRQCPAARRRPPKSLATGVPALLHATRRPGVALGRNGLARGVWSKAQRRSNRQARAQCPPSAQRPRYLPRRECARGTASRGQRRRPQRLDRSALRPWAKDTPCDRPLRSRPRHWPWRHAQRQVKYTGF